MSLNCNYKPRKHELYMFFDPLLSCVVFVHSPSLIL